MSLDYQSFIGPGISAVIDDLARLRITVFRDWPYLYDGDEAYERDYLARYAAGDSILVAAYAGAEMVGASTGMPLSDHADEFAESFNHSEVDMNNAFYCAESIILFSHRGKGAGHRFFDAREAHARRLGFGFSVFCSVIRSPDHPARPAGYRQLDAFWRGRGYAPLPGVVARFSWRDIGNSEETEKPLQFWGKRL